MYYCIFDAVICRDYCLDMTVIIKEKLIISMRIIIHNDYSG